MSPLAAHNQMLLDLYQTIESSPDMEIDLRQ